MHALSTYMTFTYFAREKANDLSARKPPTAFSLVTDPVLKFCNVLVSW